MIVLDPNQFGPKRAALTCDPDSGLEQTVVKVRVGDKVYAPDPADLNAQWDTIDGVPAALVAWPSAV